MTATKHDAFEAWLDEDHPQNPVRTRRDCFGEMGCAIAKHTWQAATAAERECVAIKATELAKDAAIVYAGGYPVNFDHEIGGAIRSGK